MRFARMPWGVRKRPRDLGSDRDGHGSFGNIVRLNCRGAACRQIDECLVVARARFSVGELGLLVQEQQTR